MPFTTDTVITEHTAENIAEAGVCFHYRHWPASIGKNLCKCISTCAGNGRPIGIRRFDLIDPTPQQNEQ